MHVHFYTYGGSLIDGEVVDEQQDMFGRHVVTVQTYRGREVFTFLNPIAYKKACGELPLFDLDYRCIRPSDLKET